MSRVPLPYSTGDISNLARSLRRNLEGLERIPSHVEMLNLLAKAGGYRNFQHFKAQKNAEAALRSPEPIPAKIDFKLVKRLLRFFDENGRLIRKPKKLSQFILCLWVMWSRIPARTSMTEGEISRLLDAQHLFGDHALLRRELVDRGMAARTPDGREYRRIERRPPAEAAALLEHLRPSPADTHQS